MEYIVILSLVIQTTNLVLLKADCPTSCKCSASTIECRTVIPKFLPADARKVIVHEATLPHSIDFSDPRWSNVTYLAINPGSKVSKPPTGKQVSLHENEFENLNNLKYLQIACSCLRHVSISAFKGLDKLEVLDLSNNILTRESFVNALVGEKNLPILEELNLSNTATRFGGIFKMDSDFLNAVRNKPLKVFDISQTSYSFTRYDRNVFSAFSSLEKLNVSGAGNAMRVLMETQQRFLWVVFPGFPMLKTLDASYPPPSFHFSLIAFSGLFSTGRKRAIGSIKKQLREFHGKKMFIHPFKIYNLEDNKDICCSLQSQGSQQFEICIKGGFHLEKINFAENSILFIDPKLLKKMTSLKAVEISRNLLGEAISKEGYLQSTIANLYRLEELYLSYNEIFLIPEEAFESAHTLNTLDLSNNNLETITFKTDSLVSLQRLILSSNSISVLDGISLDRLSYLKLQKLNDTFLGHTKTDIDLNGNPITCGCENRQYISLVLTLNETASCLLDDKRRFIDEYVLKHAEFLCKMSFVLLIYLTLAAVVVIVTTVFAYYVIKERKEVLRNRHIQAGIQEYRERHANARDPPVFLSFCSDDDEIVMSEIVPKLDEGLKTLLQTDHKCVATGYNDFRPGFSLANEIIRCVEEAAVVIFFVTNTFCKKMWCRNEALVAHYENKQMILMIWEELDLKQMPKYMLLHYQEHTRVHWIQEGGQRVMKPDMEKLCEAIVSLFKD